MKRPIDHVVFAGQDLEKLQKEFSAAGFNTSYGGVHSNGITHMYLIGFGNRSYIELISKNDLEGEAPWWDKQIDEDIGATAWSISVEDIEAESERLAANGFEIEGPTEFSRARPDGTDVKWELSIVGGRPQGTPLPMLEMDHTPLEWRVDITMDPEETGLEGLTDVVIGAKDLEATIEMFQTFYNGNEVEIRRDESLDARIASINGTAASIAEPCSSDSPVADRVARQDEVLPYAFLIEATDISVVKNQFRIEERIPWGDDTVYWFDIDVGGRLGAIDRS